jgi:hypothetical protein
MRPAIGLLVLAATTFGAACATSRAQIPEPEPTLVVPPVPPRSIEPAPVPLPAVDPMPAEPPPPAPPPPRTNRTRPAAEAKAEPKPEPPADAAANTPAPNPSPVPPLRTPATPTGQEAVRQIREILDATQKMLDSVGSLTSDDRKANYATARSLLQQSEEAIKKEELTQARSFAERAQNIAKVLLSGR